MYVDSNDILKAEHNAIIAVLRGEVPTEVNIADYVCGVTALANMLLAPQTKKEDT